MLDFKKVKVKEKEEVERFQNNVPRQVSKTSSSELDSSKTLGVLIHLTGSSYRA